MFKLQYLMLAMTEFEGWYRSGHPKFLNGSTSYRNHNPGNMRSSPFQSGTSNGFAVFDNDIIGWHAMQWDLTQKCKGKTTSGLKPESTIEQLINVWAPAADKNNTSEYVKFVCEMTGFSKDMQIKELID